MSAHKPTIQQRAATWAPHKHKQMSAVLFWDRAASWLGIFALCCAGFAALFCTFLAAVGTLAFGLALSWCLCAFIAAGLAACREHSRLELEAYSLSVINALEDGPEAAIAALRVALPEIGFALSVLEKFMEEVSDVEGAH